MTPIEKLVALSNPTPVSEPWNRAARVERFEDLQPGMEVWIQPRPLSDEWGSGVVRKIDEYHQRTYSRDVWVPRGMRAVIRTTRGTTFLYSYRWDERDRHRVRLVKQPTLMEVSARATKQTLVVGPALTPADQEQLDGRIHRPIDGMTPDAILATYTAIMREQMSPTILDGKTPRLTKNQIECARMMWSARLGAKVRASDEDRRARAPSVVVECDLE